MDNYFSFQGITSIKDIHMLFVAQGSHVEEERSQICESNSGQKCRLDGLKEFWLPDENGKEATLTLILKRLRKDFIFSKLIFAAEAIVFILIVMLAWQLFKRYRTFASAAGRKNICNAVSIRRGQNLDDNKEQRSTSKGEYKSSKLKRISTAIVRIPQIFHLIGLRTPARNDELQAQDDAVLKSAIANPAEVSNQEALFDQKVVSGQISKNRTRLSRAMQTALPKLPLTTLKKKGSATSKVAHSTVNTTSTPASAPYKHRMARYAQLQMSKTTSTATSEVVCGMKSRLLDLKWSNIESLTIPSSSKPKNFSQANLFTENIPSTPAASVKKFRSIAKPRGEENKSEKSALRPCTFEWSETSLTVINSSNTRLFSKQDDLSEEKTAIESARDFVRPRKKRLSENKFQSLQKLYEEILATLLADEARDARLVAASIAKDQSDRFEPTQGNDEPTSNCVLPSVPSPVNDGCRAQMKEKSTRETKRSSSTASKLKKVRSKRNAPVPSGFRKKVAVSRSGTKVDVDKNLVGKRNKTDQQKQRSQIGGSKTKTHRRPHRQIKIVPRTLHKRDFYCYGEKQTYEGGRSKCNESGRVLADLACDIPAKTSSLRNTPASEAEKRIEDKRETLNSNVLSPILSTPNSCMQRVRPLESLCPHKTQDSVQKRCAHMLNAVMEEGKLTDADTWLFSRSPDSLESVEPERKTPSPDTWLLNQLCDDSDVRSYTSAREQLNFAVARGAKNQQDQKTWDRREDVTLNEIYCATVDEEWDEFRDSTINDSQCLSNLSFP